MFEKFEKILQVFYLCNGVWIITVKRKLCMLFLILDQIFECQKFSYFQDTELNVNLTRLELYYSSDQHLIFLL